MKRIVFILITLIFTSCIPKVTPNEFVVVTADCWNSMKVIQAGDVPPRLLTTCDRKIVLPAYLMDGSASVPARFMGDVKGLINIDYQYEIVDAILFIQNAKFVTSSQTDSGYRIEHNTLERAENTAIDKIAKDITRQYMPSVNPSNIDEGQIEDDLTPMINDVLAKRGIVISTVSVDVDLKKQTEEALDVISAYNLYKTAGLESLGEKVISNQAMKPEIRIEQKNNPE